MPVAIRLVSKISKICSLQVSLFLNGLLICLYTPLGKKIRESEEKGKKTKNKCLNKIDTKAVLSLINHSLSDLFAYILV